MTTDELTRPDGGESAPAGDVDAMIPEAETPAPPPLPAAPPAAAPPAPGGGTAAWLRANAWVVVVLGAILAAAAHLRLVGLDWDSGHHLHPDERFLTMVESSLALPSACVAGPDGAVDAYGCFLGYMDTDTSPLNPRNQGHGFFAYGTWPITLVYLVARQLGKTDYHTVYMVGRQFSVLVDLLALVLLFGLGARLYGARVGLLAAALGAFTAFFVQQSHFFTVDGPANFFVVLFFFFAVGMRRRGGWVDTVLAGVALGMALASKVSVWPLAPVALVVLGLTAVRRGGDGPAWREAAGKAVLLGLTSFAALRLCMPDMFVGPGWPNVVDDPTRYAQVTSGEWIAPDLWHALRDTMPDALEPLLLPDPRWMDSMRKVSELVTGHGVDWPPNHQWWNRTDYVFPWRNMVQWGMGIPLGLAAWLGWAWAGWELVRRRRLAHALPWLWVTLFFAYYGGQWTKTMRYFLPLYPTLILFGAYGLVALYDRARGARPPVLDPEDQDPPAPDGARPARPRLAPAALALMAVVVGATAVWGFMFSRIYTRDHSRVAGSRWIYHNLPTAFGLTVKGGADGAAPGRFLPANWPQQIRMVSGTHQYRVDDGAWVGPARVLIPGTAPITVDGVHLAHVTDPDADADADAETFEVVLSTAAFLGEDGRPDAPLASGTVDVALGADAQSVNVPLPETELWPPAPATATPPPLGGDRLGLTRYLPLGATPEPPAAPADTPVGEYYLWLRVEGAPVRGRPSILAIETRWDDAIPLGLDGYAARDDAQSEWGEGLFGSSEMDLYDADTPAKVDQMLDWMAAADYVMMSSNRVYGAIAQLPNRWPMTLRYYDALFAEAFGIRHVADIHSYPSLGAWEVNDQPAEEAWHVYDHPKVDVFAVDGVDRAALRAALLPLTGPEHVTFEWPQEGDGGVRGLYSRLRGAVLGDAGDAALGDAGVPLEAVMLSDARREAQRARGDWIFDTDSFVNRAPWAGVVWWYAVLALVGLAAFPLVATVLPNLADRGWAVARTAGVLTTSWLAWLAASLGWADHTPALVWAAAAALGLVSAGLAWRDRSGLRAWLAANRRLVVAEEAVCLGLFAFFLAIRVGNPDLWHPYYGGEKPMDFAYLNAVLRTVAFPPYDPWFAGGQLNYYYYGFVFVGALIEMTRIVPWIAYNLAIPTLAALTGLGVFGAAYNWSRAARRGPSTGARAGALAAVLAVVSGNLFQVPYIAQRLSEVSGSTFESALPGVQTLVRAVQGWAAVMADQASVSVQTGWWYWNASRAIPEQGDVAPITEFPFFTFVYADLHAHMMALPITVLALTVALSWAVLTEDERRGFNWPFELWGLGRLLLGALAVGALWPANTWDFPTYGLVAAGALAAGQWQRLGGPGRAWLFHVGLRGGLLLGLSLLFFAPYHQAYVTPYASFRAWDSVKTPLEAYIVVHGIFLFAITTWVLVRLAGALRAPDERPAVLRVLAATGGLTALVLGALYLRSVGALAGSEYPPSPWTPLFAGVLLTLGTGVLLRPRAAAPERFAAWIFVLGVLLTLFVEYVVLDGDIGRMNTVFKFYIQIWVLWSVLAAVALAWMDPLRRWSARTAAATVVRAWGVAFAALVACGLVYTVTAARAKIHDRFPAAYGMDPAEREGYEERNFRASLSGMAYLDYALYDDDGHLLRLSHDRDAMRWLHDHVDGTPTILEGFRVKGYRWGSRYSIYTGLPTVIGWDWHQKQQRNAIGHHVVDARTADVATIYDTPDAATAAALLDQYHVDYVIVGEMERAFYAADGLAKFDAMVDDGHAELVYAGGAADDPAGEPAVKIYRLDRAAEEEAGTP